MSRLVYYAVKQKRSRESFGEYEKFRAKLNSCLFEIRILPMAWESYND